MTCGGEGSVSDCSEDEDEVSGTVEGIGDRAEVEGEGSVWRWKDGEGTRRVASSRMTVNALFIALTGLGSPASDGPLMVVGMLGASFGVVITLGSKGCKPTVLNDFMMFSVVNALMKGSSIAWRKVHLFIAPKPSHIRSSRIWA